MLYPFGGHDPVVPETAFVAPGARVIGDVVLGEDVSIWFSAVLRGDVNFIRVRARSNLQDGVVVHVNAGAESTTVEEEVTVGHQAILHGCHLGRRSLIGMGSVVLDGVSVGEEAMVAAGADRVVSIDFHQHQIQGFFDIPVDHLYAAPVFTAYFRGKELPDLVVVAPDVGSAKMARGFAKRLGASLAIIDKRRPAANVSEVLNVVGDVANRTCLITDDMIDTGGTIAQAVQALIDRGARSVYVAATHALLSGEAVARLSAAPLEELVVTNTIDIPESKRFDRLRVLSVADLLARAITYIHSNASVSQLFELRNKKDPPKIALA